MSDYAGKVYRKQGGDELVVASGGVITVEEGGAIIVGGADVTAAVVTVASLPTTDPEDGLSIWNDAGSLKLASAGG
ncbi:hypothetical protein NVS89_22520 [Ancylobacter sp. MQZ15Z-1]|uniref:Uncharacterized protein n=1 Tax=Ancylobacter mangrovi TaxID=2972472 RepID=A0A9X2PI48_9HYPH|nr:hypothetical protein [Ancylobacter mangrovi]MCS0497869.1 hypothetical protein [Ancylobacter mangrovi]